MNTIKALLETLGQVVLWLKERRLGWLAPLVLVLLALGLLFALAAAVPAVSPFVYLLF